jgi:predicted metal-dependent phosphoesterase TrpH
MGEEGFTQKVHKIIGRKACRHYANLLLECFHTAREAAGLMTWEKAKAEDPSLTMATSSSAGKETPSRSQGQEALAPKALQGKAAGTPARPIERKEEGFFVDLHVHTLPASPCSAMGVDEVIEEAKRIGLDGICLTDHNHVWDSRDIEALREKHGFLVLRGNEITTDQGDVLVFGFHRDFKGIVSLDDLRKEVAAAGGFMIVAHPFRGFLTFNVGQLGLTPEKAAERSLFRQIDAVEVLNGKVTAKENGLAQEVASILGLPTAAGSDAHEIKEIGVYATRFSRVIRSEDELLEALKSGDYSAVHFRKDMGLN